MSGRIVVVINKSWEADVIVPILLHEKAAPREFGLRTKGTKPPIKVVNHPFFQAGKGTTSTPLPRVVLTLQNLSIELSCLQDLMSEAVSSSSSKEKADQLPKIAAYGEKPSLIIAMGTASLPAESDMNASVVVGRKVFVHDPFANEQNRTGMWTPPHPDAVLDSPELPAKLFDELDIDARFPAEGRFLRPPLGRDAVPRVLATAAHVGLSTVNVTRYDDYVWTDAETQAKFLDVTQRRLRIGSMESTHALIREVLGTPFLFISGIANPTGRFDFEVAPRDYAQNFVASHNAGMTLAWLLPQLPEVLSKMQASEKAKPA